jgi:hypothetical protein
MTWRRPCASGGWRPRRPSSAAASARTAARGGFSLPERQDAGERPAARRLRRYTRIGAATALTKELDLCFAFIYRRDCEIGIDLLACERIDPGAMVTDHFDGFCEAFAARKRPSDRIKVMLERG